VLDRLSDGTATKDQGKATLMESERLDLRDLDLRHEVVRNYGIRTAKAQKVDTLTPLWESRG